MMVGGIGMKTNDRIIAAILVFALLAVVADNINLSQLVGSSNQYFTAFQLFAPTIGAFIGPYAGIGAVLFGEAASFVWNGKEASAINLLRMLPMLAAVYYFANFAKKRGAIVQATSALLPIACMALFILHPVGAQAWQYSLFWLIPAIVMLLPQNLFLRSLGATFSAHAIGGVVWLYLFPATPAYWMALIPIVVGERLMFAAGISVSFVAVNTVLARASALQKWVAIQTEEKYNLAPVIAKIRA
jgi:hypothetical protein